MLLGERLPRQLPQGVGEQAQLAVGQAVGAIDERPGRVGDPQESFVGEDVGGRQAPGAVDLDQAGA